MAKIQERRSKFRRAVDELAMQIYNGKLEPGAQMYSRKELCELFDISLMTAHRVQSELHKLGLLSAQSGQRFIINAPGIVEPEGFKPLRRVISIGGRNAIGPGTFFGERIMAGVSQECAEHNLEHVIEYVNVHENPPGFINTGRRLKADEGLALFLGRSLLPEVVSLLMTPTLRVSLINESMPGHISVRSDLRHCVKSILDALIKRKCRKILRASYFHSYESSLNEAESLEALEDLCEANGLDLTVCTSGNHRELLEICKQWQPDGLFFNEAVSACHFLRNYAPSLARTPIVAAGPWAPHPKLPEFPEYDNIIAYEQDLEAMGRAAVRQLLEYKTLLQAVCNVRVRGMIRESKRTK